jgi:hypothetical protein
LDLRLSTFGPSDLFNLVRPCTQGQNLFYFYFLNFHGKARLLTLACPLVLPSRYDVCRPDGHHRWLFRCASLVVEHSERHGEITAWVLRASSAAADTTTTEEEAMTTLLQPTLDAVAMAAAAAAAAVAEGGELIRLQL